MKAPLKRLWTDFYGWIQDKLPIRSKEWDVLDRNRLANVKHKYLRQHYKSKLQFPGVDRQFRSHACFESFVSSEKSPKSHQAAKRTSRLRQVSFHLHSDTSPDSNSSLWLNRTDASPQFPEFKGQTGSPTNIYAPPEKGNKTGREETNRKSGGSQQWHGRRGLKLLWWVLWYNLVLLH